MGWIYLAESADSVWPSHHGLDQSPTVRTTDMLNLFFCLGCDDVNSEIVSLFRVLRDSKKATQLESVLKLTPWARDEFNQSYESSSDEIEQARRTVCRAFMGHGATGACRDGRTGFRAKGYQGNGTASYAFGNYAECIPAFTERLKGVIIENKDAFELFEAHDSSDTLFFVDPPYVHDTRNYKHGYKFEMEDSDHRRLCEALKPLKGMVILCGYPNSIYESLGWEFVQTESKTDSNATRTEVLWLNPAAASAQMQKNLFESGKSFNQQLMCTKGVEYQ